MIDYIKNNQTKKLQKYELEILKKFHEICESNNLKYILDYGTLLGAIRHEGFIPWDDDIDVAMQRKDFVKFEQIASKVLPENMFLQTHKTDKNYYVPLPKIRLIDDNYKEKSLEHFDIVHGPWIDIFVYDFKYELRKKEEEKQKVFNKKQNFRAIITPTLISAAFPNRNFFKTYIKQKMINLLKKSQMKEDRGLVMRFLDYKYSNLEKLLKEIPENNSNGEIMTYTFPVTAEIPEKIYTLNINDFENRKLQKFEDGYFYIPEKYHRVLTDRYGNYTELPPYEERVSNHEWANH